MVEGGGGFSAAAWNILKGRSDQCRARRSSFRRLCHAGAGRAARATTLRSARISRSLRLPMILYGLMVRLTSPSPLDRSASHLRTGCHLIEEGHEKMIILPVDDGCAGIPATQFSRAGQAGKTCSSDIRSSAASSRLKRNALIGEPERERSSHGSYRQFRFPTR